MIFVLPKKDTSIKTSGDYLFKYNLLPISICKVFSGAEELNLPLRGQGKVEYQIPKFTQRSKINLKNLLKGLGVVDIFDSTRANLSKLSDQIYVSDILHEAVVVVDEKGSEAAAVTIGTCGIMCCDPTPIIKICFDKTFNYGIINSSGMLLFAGEYHGN